MNNLKVVGATLGSPCAIIVLLLILFCTHWLGANTNVFTASKMTVQDIRIGIACRDLETSWLFAGRSHADYRMDAITFRVPHGNLFVCEIYAGDAFRDQNYRISTMRSTYEHLPEPSQHRIQLWLAKRGWRNPVLSSGI